MHTTSEAAESLGIDRWQVAKFCQRLGVGTRKSIGWLLSDADIETIRQHKTDNPRGNPLMKTKAGQRKLQIARKKKT